MTDRKPVILVDIDDTLNQFAVTFWQTYNKLYNEKMNYELVDSWDLQKYARPDINVYELLKLPGLFRYIPLKEYAVPFMQNLCAHFDVYIVTDSPKGTSDCEITGNNFSNPADDKRKWVQERFPFFPQDKIIICSHKWMIDGDVLIDDKPATFEKYIELGKKCILIDAPYNRHIETKWRAKSLMEAEKMVKEILRQPVGSAI